MVENAYDKTMLIRALMTNEIIEEESTEKSQTSDRSSFLTSTPESHGNAVDVGSAYVIRVQRLFLAWWCRLRWPAVPRSGRLTSAPADKLAVHNFLEGMISISIGVIQIVLQTSRLQLSRSLCSSKDALQNISLCSIW